MSLREELLAPIAGDNPAGVDMRYDPLFDKIKEARREDEDVPQGEWTAARKVADWPVVIRLAKEALATKTKDLQLAAWLTEALLRREGFAGLRDGLDLLAGLVESHWDHLYPEIDDGDAEMRAAPLEWVSVKLDLQVRLAAIDRVGHGLIAFKDSRNIPTEAAIEAEEDSEKRASRIAARESALASGKVAPEDFETGFTATPKPWYRTLVADLASATDALKALDEVASAKFGDVAPNFSRLSDALDEVSRFAAQQLKRKLELEPDPIVDSPVADAGADGAGAGVAAAGAGSGGALTPEPTSIDDAAARIVGAARYLRQNAPFNPSSYLLLRGFRWGELRASATLDPKLLEAPPTNVRTKLKGLLLDGRWPELVEAAEGVMGTPQGRGWIDLQRYAITAIDALGSDYEAVAVALRGALRALITDLPQLLDMTLMDDTPTANVETRGWLRNTIHVEAGAAGGVGEAGAGAEFEAPGRDPISQANAEVRAGRAERAIAMLMRESSREKTRRGRFLFQSELARIMVEAGHQPVAMPILEELIADIEAYKLEEWEAGPVVAAPMALLFRCLENAQGDEVMRQGLYLRICRLDPIQAISFGPR